MKYVTLGEQAIVTHGRHTVSMAGIEITYDGRPVLTAALAGERYNLALDAMRQALRRADLQPVAALDARTPLYDAGQVAAAMAARPGKGANLRRTESALSSPSDQD